MENILSIIENEMLISFNITINRLGGFEIGDGEYFNEDVLSTAVGTDFFIKTNLVDHVYRTVFIPNPLTVEDLKNQDCTCEDHLSLFREISIYETTKEDIVNYLVKNNFKFGIWDVELKNGVLHINDMMWFYLGFCSCGIETKLPLSDSLYTDLEKILKTIN